MIPAEVLGGLEQYFSDTTGKSFGMRRSRPLGGGSINEVFHISAETGEYCLKYNSSKAYPGMFEAEARGLSLLAASKTLTVPSVITAQSLNHYSFILMEYIDSSAKTNNFFEDFGQRLAMLHRNSADRFGLDHDNYMGSLRQSNGLHAGWAEFFISERLIPQVNLALNEGLIEPSQIKLFETLYSRLHAILPSEPPSLVHGDLWSGNFIVSSEGTACLIDPAAYYGNREVDLAMSTLFGGFGREFYDAYHEAFPLPPGWRQRLDILNLYPLLIHLNLFGRSYLGQILSVLERF
jgi:fructosamine-3-kinase